MKPYPAYKDSGVEWLGEIPEHWHLGKLKYLAQINPSKNGSLLNASEEMVTFLPMEKVGENGEIATDIKKPVHELLSGFTYFEENDVILAKITPCFENGKGAHLTDLGSRFGFGSTEFHVIRDVENVSIAKYLYYVTRTDLFRSTGEAFMTGSAGQKRVPASFVEDFALGIPPVEEQQAVAEYLERKTMQIDTLIAKKERQIELLQEQRAAIINQAVTSGLNPDAPMKDSGIEWLGEIPIHWEVIKTKYLFRLSTEKAPEDNDFELLSLYTDIGVRPRKDLEAKGNKATTTDGYWMVKKWDIIVNKLLAWMGAVGVSEYDGVTSPAYDILRHTVPLDSKYYHYLFRCGVYLPEFRRRSRGIMDMRLRLYFDELGQIPVPYPPVVEQEEIVAKLEDRIAQVDLFIQKTQTLIAELREYRTAIISAAVTGKIDVRNEVKETSIA